MSLRIVHPSQQGFRLSPLDTLFQQVDAIAPEPIEQIPVPEVTEMEWPALLASVEHGSGAQ